MDLILGNLTDLKSFILPATERSGTDWDAALAAIGMGVATSFERYCNRRFGRVAGASMTFPGGRSALALERFPVEAVTALALQEDFTSEWDNILDMVEGLDGQSGVVRLVGWVGSPAAQIRVDFTGGFWNDPTEDRTGQMPTGATAVPEDLRYAWLLECSHVWSLRDNIGAAMIVKDKATPSARLAESDFVPAVKTILDGYRRYAF